MSYLTQSQLDAIKAARARAWIRPFTIERITEEAGDDFYDEPTATAGSPVLTIYSGSYIWKPKGLRRGSPGGVFDTADLVMETDILYSGVLVFSGARLIVEGVRCAITSINPIPDFGAIVVTAKKIE